MLYRQLMLHNYLPAHLASTMVAGSLVDLLDSREVDEKPVTKTAIEKSAKDDQTRQPKAIPASKPQQPWRSFAGSSMAAWTVCGTVLLVTLAFWCFWSPLTYGYPALSMEAVQRRARFGRLQYLYE